MVVVFEGKNKKEIRHLENAINVSVQELHGESAYGVTYRSTKSGELKFKGYPLRCWKLINVNNEEVR